jgi:hypothetical protein
VVTDTDVALVDRLWRELEDHRWELGRYPSVVPAVRSSVAIEPASLVAMIELAEPDEHGSYTHGDRGAALLADHFLADEPLSDETRSKLLAILGDVHQRATGRFARYVDRLGSEWSPFENERRS